MMWKKSETNLKKNYLNMGGFMVLNATFNNISAISWRSVLLVKETGVPGENSWPERGSNSQH